MATIKALFRRTNPEQLRKYFADRWAEFPTDFEWDATGKKFVDALDEALSEAPSLTEGGIRSELDRIATIANLDGWNAIEEVFAGASISLDADQGLHDAIFALVLEHPELLDRAMMQASLKRRNGGRDWAAFRFPDWKGNIDLSDEDQRCKFVGNALEILAVPEGRKREADWYTAIKEDETGARTIHQTQVTIYSEDRPDTALSFDGSNTITRQVIQRVGEINFTFDPTDQVFEVCARGGRAIREQYAAAFSETFLGERIHAIETPRRDIDFSVLNREPAFEIEPSDGIDCCAISDLSFWSNAGGFLSFQHQAKRNSVHAFIDQCFHERSPLQAPGWRITAATLRIHKFKNGNTGPTRVLTVDLKSPNRTTLRNKTEVDRLFITQLLERWKLFKPIAPSETLIEVD